MAYNGFQDVIASMAGRTVFSAARAPSQGGAAAERHGQATLEETLGKLGTEKEIDKACADLLKLWKLDEEPKCNTHPPELAPADAKRLAKVLLKRMLTGMPWSLANGLLPIGQAWSAVNGRKFCLMVRSPLGIAAARRPHCALNDQLMIAVGNELKKKRRDGCNDF